MEKTQNTMQVIQLTSMYRIILFSFIVFGLNSCGTLKLNNKLSNYSTKVSSLAKANISSQDKFDDLAGIMVEVLEESLTFARPKHTVQFIKGFSNQNQASIKAIYEETAQWYTDMNPIQKISATAQLASKPYARQLVDLVPKVEKKTGKKIRQFMFLGKFMSLFNFF